MKGIIGCEESQILTILLRSLGHEVYSCDLKVQTGGHPEWHLRGDLFKMIEEFGPFDFGIIHPPCTYLTVTANKWLKDQKARHSGKLTGEKRRIAQKEAEEFFMKCWNLKSKIPKLCLENPVGSINSILPPTQIIQPYFFGDSEKKRTCLWLNGFPPLQHFKEDDLFAIKTHVKEPDSSFTSKFAGTSINAAAFRSKTFPGIAKAIGDQWFG